MLAPERLGGSLRESLVVPGTRMRSPSCSSGRPTLYSAPASRGARPAGEAGAGSGVLLLDESDAGDKNRHAPAAAGSVQRIRDLGGAHAGSWGERRKALLRDPRRRRATGLGSRLMVRRDWLASGGPRSRRVVSCPRLRP